MDDSRKINDNDNDNFKELISEFQTLSTFVDVKDWSRRAGDEIEKIAGIVRALDVEIARTAETLEHIKYEHAQKSLMERLFGGRNNKEKELTQRLEQLRQSRSERTKAALQLQDSIDFTPTSPEQQKMLIQELRLRSREFQEKKREITMVIKGPRTQPQSQNAAEAVFDAATLERRKARYARDAELLLQEKTGESLSRQIAQLDRDISWAQKFT